MSKNVSDVAAQKKNILSNNANARLLGKNKVVYSRRDEEHDTLVIRDLSDKSNFDHFGVKGVKELERLLFTILGSMSEHRTTLLKRGSEVMLYVSYLTV